MTHWELGMAHRAEKDKSQNSIVFISLHPLHPHPLLSQSPIPSHLTPHAEF
ncbi:MAG TPA: hypothetical protein IGS40_12565 [Trichormus sp. M33_DOE_039]|nr:hypothetical protein [Trichormus sp. M33_DOE_039]